MLCLDLVTMTHDEDGDSKSRVLMDEIFGGWCVEGWGGGAERVV